MMIEINQVLQAIKSLGKPATTLAINQAQRNEIVIQVLKSLRLDPTQPPKDVDGVYAYTIVEYGVFKPEPILKLFREKDIKTAFWQAYTSNQALGFLKEVEKFLAWNVLGDEIRAAGIKVPDELEEFGKVFISVAQRTKSSDFQPYPDWNMDEYPEEFKPLILEKIRSFCGRKFVFEAFAQFLKENTNGYFTVVGDAGMGKSAIAAKYGLESSWFLSFLLQKISDQLQPRQKLIIAIDALDAVDYKNQHSGANIFYKLMRSSIL